MIQGEREIWDFTGVFVRPAHEGIKIPYATKKVTSEFVQRAFDVVGKGNRDLTFKDYLRGVFVNRSVEQVLQDFSHPQPNWQVLGRESVENMLNESPYDRNEINGFRIWEEGVRRIEMDCANNPDVKNSLVSGNDYGDRDKVVQVLGSRITKKLDDEYSIVLPFRRSVTGVELKVATAVWFREKMGERVRAREDDIYIALCESIVCDQIEMPVTEEEAFAQRHWRSLELPDGIDWSRIKYAQERGLAVN